MARSQWNLVRCLLAVMAGLPTACVQHTQPIVAPPALTPAQKNFQAVWDASLDVLVEYGFRIDTAGGAILDRRDGLIRTQPIVGQQWWEFWRRDGATDESRLESSFQKIFRAATVRIVPADSAGETFQATVSIAVARSDRPVREFTDTSETLSMYNTASFSFVDPQLVEDATYMNPAQRRALRASRTPLPNDDVLARQISDAIQQRTLKNQSPPAP